MSGLRLQGRLAKVTTLEKYFIQQQRINTAGNHESCSTHHANTSMDSGVTACGLQWPPVSSMYNVITGHLSMWPAHHLLHPGLGVKCHCRRTLSDR